MRDILFRAKAVNRPPKGTYRTDYENGDWVYGLISDISEYGALMTNTDGVGGIDVDKGTICEYTGLLDKNGNKIFEGDILQREYNMEKSIVKYKRGWFYSESLPKHDGSQTICNSITAFDDMNVVGNIYDTPELLEDKQ